MLETLLSEKRAGGKMLVKLTPVHFKHEYPVWMYELQPEQHNNLILWAAFALEIFETFYTMFGTIVKKYNSYNLSYVMKF